MQYKIQTIKYRLDWTGLGTVLQTGNLEPTKYNLVYQTIPEKIVKVDKLQSTFEGAEGTKINSIRRKAIPDVYNSLSEKYRPYSGVATLFKQFIMMTSCLQIRTKSKKVVTIHIHTAKQDLVAPC